jgi:hypothetical protein
MAHSVGLDVSQKTTAICVVDASGVRIWRGVCASNPDQIDIAIRCHAGHDAKVGVETGAMTPWLVHELRKRGLEVICLDARNECSYCAEKATGSGALESNRAGPHRSGCSASGIFLFWPNNSCRIAISRPTGDPKSRKS